uniref:Vitellogenin n=1 Tax=Anopheles christyi TaxID=43041 RepID=A0A182KE56_9DIPT
MDEKKPIPTPPNGNAAVPVSADQDENEKRVGCAHYKRRAKFVTPCCNKFYMCRYCHDENETHFFNRKTVTELICTECDTRQRVQAECEKCGVRFGRYTCLVCNLFDDEDRNQYHCDGCGICRVGGRGRFFHCEVCNMCLPLQLKYDGHRCVENVSRSNCPVCLDDIHTSRIPCHIPDCGHLLHRTCFEELLSSGHYACPTCQTSMMDMNQLWEYLDAEVAATPMPKEYANYFVDILCKDCHKESTVKFHVVGLKCTHCGAYNTCRTKTKSINGCNSTTGGSSSGGGSSTASGTAQSTNASETTPWIRMVPLSMVESDDNAIDDSAIDDSAIDDSEDERLVDRLDTYLQQVTPGDDGASTSAASSSSSNSSSASSSSSAPSSSTMVSTVSVGVGPQHRPAQRLNNGTSNGSRSDACSSSGLGVSYTRNGGQPSSSSSSGGGGSISSTSNSGNVNGTMSAVVVSSNGRTDVAGSSASPAHDEDRSSFDNSNSTNDGGAAQI